MDELTKQMSAFIFEKRMNFVLSRYMVFFASLFFLSTGCSKKIEEERFFMNEGVAPVNLGHDVKEKIFYGGASRLHELPFDKDMDIKGFALFVYLKPVRYSCALIRCEGGKTQVMWRNILPRGAFFKMKSSKEKNSGRLRLGSFKPRPMSDLSDLPRQTGNPFRISSRMSEIDFLGFYTTFVGYDWDGAAKMCFRRPKNGESMVMEFSNEKRQSVSLVIKEISETERLNEVPSSNEKREENQTQSRDGRKQGCVPRTVL